MKYIELYGASRDKPFGIIGITDSSELFLDGLDEEDFGTWLDGEQITEDGDFVSIRDGVKFLEAVKYNLEKGAPEDEFTVKGPLEGEPTKDLDSLDGITVEEDTMPDMDLQGTKDEKKGGE